MIYVRRYNFLLFIEPGLSKLIDSPPYTILDVLVGTILCNLCQGLVRIEDLIEVRMFNILLFQISLHGPGPSDSCVSQI